MKKRPKRKRRRKPQPQMQPKRLLIGYWPLLRYEDFMMVPGQQSDDIEKTARLLESQPDAPQVRAVLWARYPFDAETEAETEVIPVFVVHQAKEIAEHLITWMEGDTERFTLHIEQRETGYVVLLMPSIQKSIDRFKLARLIYHEDPVTDNDFTVIYQALGCVCPAGQTFKSVQHEIGDESRVGFLELDLLDPENIQDVDWSQIVVTEPFKVAREHSEQVMSHLDHLFEDSGSEPIDPREIKKPIRKE